MKSYAGMATFEGREESLKIAIDSLASQVDGIFLYDNSEGVDLTDNGKFWGLTQINEPCYYFPCDDDLEYPPNYIESMKTQIDRHNCIVSHHGRKLTGTNKSYYRGHQSIDFKRTNLTIKQIHVPGTAVTGFKTDYFNPIGLHEATDKKMSDLVFALESAKQGKKIIVLPHQRGWIKQIPINHLKSIKSTSMRNETRQIQLANEIFSIFNP